MKPVQLVVVGSIGLDTIETPDAKKEEILGGSVSYACASASFFTPSGMVGVVGSDFPEPCLDVYRQFGIDLQGLQKSHGKTFRWSGIYEQDMNNRRTLATELNVLATFMPELPDDYARAPFLFLANISPELQLHVLSQVKSPRFVAADTMDLWINIALKPLRDVISAVNLLTLNESEARLLAGENNLVRAAKKILGWGPQYVIIKKGEHGAMLFSKTGIFVVPAYPLEIVHDPTGAGDTFAGGLMGALSERGEVSEAAICQAMGYGSVVASFGVEDFSLGRLLKLSRPEINHRFNSFRRLTHFDALPGTLT
ncbi:MAG: PfkB family carbohydrate kinase [bacterium]